MREQLGYGRRIDVTLADMSLKIERPGIKIIVVFSAIEVSLDPQNDRINYWLSPSALYIE